MAWKGTRRYYSYVEVSQVRQGSCRHSPATVYQFLLRGRREYAMAQRRSCRTFCRLLVCSLLILLISGSPISVRNDGMSSGGYENTQKEWRDMSSSQVMLIMK